LRILAIIGLSPTQIRSRCIFTHAVFIIFGNLMELILVSNTSFVLSSLKLLVDLWA
jgi:hypothetical protein